MDLPTYDEAKAAVRAGTASALQQYIYHYEPKSPDDAPWRANLSHILREANGCKVPHDTDQPGYQVVSICVTDTDGKVAMRLMPCGLDHRHFGLLIGELVHNVAMMYRVSICDIRDWMDKELQARAEDLTVSRSSSLH